MKLLFTIGLLFSGVACSAEWVDNMEYSTQVAFEAVWPRDPLTGSSVPLSLTTEFNHTPNGSKSVKSTLPRQSSRHYFGENLIQGTMEYWFYDPGYNPADYVTFYIDARAGGAYTTFGVNRDTGIDDASYFYYFSNVGWQSPFTGPERTKGWHHVIITFGVAGTGGALYFDNMYLGNNTDMAYGCTDIGLGSNHWSGNPLICFDDIKYSSDVYTPPPVLKCGDWGYSLADLNTDCFVDFKDFAILAEDWFVSI